MKAIKSILFIALLNLAMAFIFQFGRPIAKTDVLIDVVICTVITAVICYVLIARAIRRKRSTGEIPATIPESKYAKFMPRRPIWFITILTVLSAAFIVSFSSLFLSLLEIERYSFLAFAIWKVVYATILSLILQKIIIWYLIQTGNPKIKK